MALSEAMADTVCELVTSGMERSDLNEVVSVHLRAFPQFFLSQLGPRFLRCLYEEILNDRSGVSFVCKDNGGIHGFVAGTTEPNGFYKRLLRRKWPRFAFASVIPTLRDPKIVGRLMNAFRKTDEVPPEDGSCLLMSVAVDPGSQGRGIGAVLVRKFILECKCRGSSSVRLTTDKDDNPQVNRFYSNLGFSIARTTTTAQGRVMNEYRIDLH